MFTVIVHAPAHLNAFYISWSREEPKTEKQHRVATFVKKNLLQLFTFQINQLLT